MTEHLEGLSEHHDRSTFTSGEFDEDRWFRNHALTAQRANSSRTFVIVDENNLIVGYFALTATAVARAEPPAVLVDDQPNYPVVGAVLLTRLAISEDRQGQGLGARLLASAIRKSLEVSERAAAVLLVVDARKKAVAGFYERHGFQPAPFVTHPGWPRRYYARLKDLQATFSA